MAALGISELVIIYHHVHIELDLIFLIFEKITCVYVFTVDDSVVCVLVVSVFGLNIILAI